MFDTELRALEKPQAKETSWTSDALKTAYGVKEKIDNSGWGEAAGVGLTLGAVAFGAAKGFRIPQLFRAGEVGGEVAGVAGAAKTVDAAKAVEAFAGTTTVYDKAAVLARAKSVDHFVFDLDSTLTDYYKASDVLRKTMSAELGRATGLSESVVQQSLNQTSRKLGSTYFYNDLNQIDGVRNYYAGANLNEKFAGVSQAARTAYHDALKAPAETVELFDYLRSQGKSIHVFTASPTARAMDKLQASGLSPYVDKVFTAGAQAFDDGATSGLVRNRALLSRVIPLSADAKETGRGYLAVLDKLKVEPEKIAMIGDNLRQDVQPAKRLGMFTAQASWFHKETAANILPDVELTNPTQLKSILEAAYRH